MLDKFDFIIIFLVNFIIVTILQYFNCFNFIAYIIAYAFGCLSVLYHFCKHG